MAFDIGAGFSRMGTAIATTAGSMALEAQRADLDNQKIQLADQLAGAREHAGRVETADLNLRNTKEQDTFTAGESALDRSARTSENNARITAETAIAAAHDAAGAAVMTSSDGTAFVVHPDTHRVTPLLTPDGSLMVVPPKIADSANQHLLDATLKDIDAENADYKSRIDALKDDPEKATEMPGVTQAHADRLGWLQKQRTLQERALNSPAMPSTPAITRSPATVAPTTNAKTPAQLDALIKKSGGVDAAIADADPATANALVDYMKARQAKLAPGTTLTPHQEGDVYQQSGRTFKIINGVPFQLTTGN